VSPGCRVLSKPNSPLDQATWARQAAADMRVRGRCWKRFGGCELTELAGRSSTLHVYRKFSSILGLHRNGSNNKAATPRVSPYDIPHRQLWSRVIPPRLRCLPAMQMLVRDAFTPTLPIEFFPARRFHTQRTKSRASERFLQTENWYQAPRNCCTGHTWPSSLLHRPR